MKILLLGANGGIGSLILKKALNHENQVTAYVRRPDAIDFTHENLTVVVGDLNNVSLIKSLITKADVVISALGPAMDMSRKVKSTPLADAHKMILDFMEPMHEKRFITIGTTTIKAKDDVRHFSNTFLPLFVKLLFPTGYLEYLKIGEHMNASQGNWTVVRFLDPKAKHKNNEYRVTLDGKTSQTKISRENIANFVYRVVSEKQYNHQMPLIFH